MSFNDVENLKDILCIVTAAYAAYLGYRICSEEERRIAAKKKRRMKALARSQLGRGDSTSSEEERKTKPYAGLLNLVETNDEQQVAAVSKKRQMASSKPRTIKNKKLRAAASGGNFVELVVSKFSDEQFKRHFRVSRKTMDKLHDLFINSTEYKNIFKLGDGTKMPAKYYVMMFLWFAGKKCSFLELSKVFHVPMSRSVSVIDTVLLFLNNCAGDYIRFPDTPSEKRNSAEAFQEVAQFPDVIGCLVNTYIEVRIPSEESAYQNVTTTIQAICDAKGRFLDVFVDATHKVHHIDMLQRSPINEKLKEICQGRYHILADGEYNVREWLLTPYTELMSSAHTLYNRKHKSTVERVSNSFDVLKQRFEQLTNVHSFCTFKIKKMIIACCVVQNICIEENDCYDVGDPLEIHPNEVEEGQAIATDVIADNTHLQKIGELKRKQITEELNLLYS